MYAWASVFAPLNWSNLKITTRRLIASNCQARSLAQITAFQQKPLQRTCTAHATLQLYLWFFIGNLCQRKIYCLISYSMFECALCLHVRDIENERQRASTAFGAGTRCLIQLNLRCRAAINTFEDKLSINFPWVKIIELLYLVATIDCSRKFLVVTSASPRRGGKFMWKSVRTVCTRLSLAASVWCREIRLARD